MGALRSMTSFLGYSEPEEETYEDSYEAVDAGYAVQEHESDFVDEGYEDFSAGLVFGLHGAIERVTPRVFLLTPASVEIDGGEVAEAHGRFFNQS